MIFFIIRRLISTIPILLVVATMSFLLIHMTPGDPARMIMGDLATEESVRALREQLGLDAPIYVQFYHWLSRAFVGDLGQSLFLHQPVLTAILERIEPTVTLVGFAFFFSIIIGLPLGVVAANHYNSTPDHILMSISLLGMSMPSFWLGLNLILVFSVSLGWFAVAGYTPLGEGLVPFLRHIFLPSFALGFSQAALVARMTRTSMLEVLRKDYIRTARAKGVRESVIIYKHALRNALIPIITVMGLIVTIMVGGAVVIETVFAIPGTGRLIIGSVLRRDYPTIQGAMILIAVICVLINLLVDILYTWVDPRVRYD